MNFRHVCERPRVPQWYEQARFGIFIHWGLYSVPGFGNESYSRNMYREGTPEYAHHRETYGPQDRFGYKDFIPLFKAKKFDPRAWAKLFREAGARYVVQVAEHHDGFVKVWSVRLLGVAKPLAFTQDAVGLHLQLPAARTGSYAWVYRIETR